MHKKLLLISIMLLSLGLFVIPVSAAWVFVPDYGDTGWLNYTYTESNIGGFTGTAGFVVSNVGDTALNSRLLVDDLSQGPIGNAGFELTNYNGYTLVGISAGAVVNSNTAHSGTIYYPFEGSWMSEQDSNNVNTNNFLNAYNEPGTNGSMLELPITLAQGEQFSFAWAFLAGDYSPFHDFAKFYLKDTAGNIVFEDGLGQIAVVPLPGAVYLFGSALAGLLGLRRFRSS